jgi:hypothetical protein
VLPIRERRLAAALAAALVAGALAPLKQNWRDTPRDSFPFSYYPMFSAIRTKDKRETYLYGVDAEGGRQLLHYGCAGPGGHNQVRRQINRTVRAGRADELCRRVARGVARRPRYAAVVRVQVVTGAYDLAEYFAGRRQPHSERVRAEHAVTR